MAVKSLKNGGTYANAYANTIALADLLIVGGGGGGSKTASVYSGGMGGGAGGLLFKEAYSINPGSYTVVIGAGGAGATAGTSSTSYPGSVGSQSSFGTLIAYGGGGAASGDTTSNGIYGGGSEGGASTLLPGVWNQSGFVQGQGMFSLTQKMNNSGQGGAGAGGPGQYEAGRQNQPGFGGNGSSQFSAWLSACSLGDNVSGLYWIAGGGGGGHASYYGSPYNTNNRSAGGGAAGHANGTGNPTAAVVNTGGGGGGNGSNGTVYGSTGSAGGSGLAIIRYLTGAMTATGGTIVTSGGYTYHAFTSNGTFARTA